MAASSMPLGGVPGGSHVNIAGESDPLPQLRAASDAAHAATQGGVHGPPRRNIAVSAPQESTEASSMQLVGVRGGGSHVHLAGEGGLLPQLSVASDVETVAAQDNAHVPL